MKEKIWTKDGMKQIINSGWKEFDEQTNTIFPGQCVASTQYSMCIRPWKEKECNGYVNPEGHLLDFDLKPFRKYRIPSSIESILTDKEREQNLILYMFFTVRDGRVTPFCWVVTDYDHKLVNYCVVYGYRQSWLKRYNAAQEAMSYIIQ